MRRCRWYGYWCRCLLHCRRASRSCSDTACAILPRSFGIKPVPAGPLCSAEVDRVFCSSALEWNLLRLRISGKNWVSPAVSSSILGLCSTADALEQWETSLHKESQSPEEARIRHWKTLLLQEDAQTVQAEITTELNQLSLKAAQERMQWIAQTLIQALHGTLQERGCPEATELVEAKPVFESLPQFLSWVQGNLARTERLLRHSPGEEQVIRRIKEYIELNIHQELTRENIAAAVYLNPDYTARLFKRKTGQSLNDYIQNKRINLARQLLAGTDMPVGDLAVALGYSSFSHFTKLFKSIEGVTPSDYRKQHARMPG